jgi:multidrug efflux pump subunit AcrB
MKATTLLWMGMIPIWIIGFSYQHWFTGTVSDIIFYVGLSAFIGFLVKDLF